MTDSDPDSITISNRSGGADLDAGRDINIDGDVAGRDIIKVTNITGDQQYDVHGLANPYLGLQSFTYADCAKYAGREKLIAETVARLTAPNDPLALLFITGASGSGKSSFVQAGVLPALEKHYAALSVKWAVFRPSRDPLAALADALWRQLGLPQFDASTDFGDFLKSHTPSQQVNVIVIDQFEELFTQSNAQPRDALFALLTQLSPFRSTRTHIIATVRADYLPELFALPALYDIAKHGIDLRAMSVDELGNAIQQPLRATYPDRDTRFQSELVERLAHDSAEDAAYLPLLQVTLEEIWRKGTLTVGSYTNLADAIKQRAGKVLEYQDYDAAQPSQPRTPEEQAAILNLCLDLVDVSLDDEARRDVRRRRSKDELTSGAPERARLIDALTQARLLSAGTESGEPTHVEVDLIHETLLSNWGKLRDAIKERRHELQQRARFEQQLKEWIRQNRADDYLLIGVHLAEARDLERRVDIALHSADAKDFVRRSVEREEARHQKELDDARKLAESQRLRAEEQTRSATRLRQRAAYLVVALGVALLLGIAAGVFGVQSNQNAAEAGRNAATAQAASTLAVANASTAQAASTQAVAQQTTAEAASTLAVEQRTEAEHQAKIALSGQLSTQSQTQLTHQLDQAMLLAAESYLTADTYHTRSSLLLALEQSPQLARIDRYPEQITALAFTPDGKWIAVAGCAQRDEKHDACLQNKIVFYDFASGQTGRVLAAGKGRLTGLAFTPDGSILFAAFANDRIYRLDLSAPGQPTPIPLPAFANSSGTVAISPDGKYMASSGCDFFSLTDGLCQKGGMVLWDLGSDNPPGVALKGVGTQMHNVAFSPQSDRLYAGDCASLRTEGSGKSKIDFCQKGEVKTWNLPDGSMQEHPIEGTTTAIISVDVSADG